MANKKASSTNNSLIEIIGWYGMVAIVSAYALLSFSLLSSDTLLYQFLNLSGAIGIAFISFRKKAFQPGVLNLIWTAIALVAIIKIFFF